MDGDIERVADEGALLLRGGGGGRVVQDGECWEVSTISVFTNGRDAELLARCADFRQGNPGSTVGGFGEVEGIAIASINRTRGQRGGRMF